MRMLIVLLIVLGTHASIAAIAPAAPAFSEAPPLQAADELFRGRADDEKALSARAMYKAAFERTHRGEAAWKLAMASYFVGLHRRGLSDGERETIYKEGMEAGREAIRRDPRCVECRFWTAIDIALHGQSVGIFKSISVLPEVRAHLEEVLRLQPSYAYGGAYRLLGLIDQKLPGILGGSNRRARENFEKAIAAAPDEPLNYLFLARLVDEDRSHEDEARRIVLRGLALPAPSPDRIESTEAIADLLRWLKERESPEPARGG